MGQVLDFHPVENIAPPAEVTLEDILPAQPRLLMGAGPVPVPSEVAAANAVVINHLGETMAAVTDRVREMSRYVFQTRTRHILGVAGPASAAMEMAITNLVWPGRVLVCVRNGIFSGRFAEMAQRVGARCHIVDVTAGSAADPVEVERAILAHGADVVTLVQGETSNTVWNHSLEQICQLARRLKVLTVVDAVCTLSTMPLPMDYWGVDVVVTGGQKGLSSVPGVSLIAFSNAAWDIIERRPSRSTHWCLDALLAEEFWDRKGYHYTAPVSGVLALHEALRLICRETLPVRFQRHSLSSRCLQMAVQAMGLNLLVSPRDRLNSVVGIVMPKGARAHAILDRMAHHHGVEASGAFGLNAIRIGQMGEQCRPHNTWKAVGALGLSLREAGFEVDLDEAWDVFESSQKVPQPGPSSCGA